MIESGTVVRVAGDRAAVGVARRAETLCRRCRACQSAGGGERVLWVEAGDLVVGDGVTLEVPLPGVWRSIGLVFALPLAALVAGLVVGSRWAWLAQATGLGAEGSAAVLSGALALVAFFLAVLQERRFVKRHGVRVVEVRHPA